MLYARMSEKSRINNMQKFYSMSANFNVEDTGEKQNKKRGGGADPAVVENAMQYSKVPHISFRLGCYVWGGETRKLIFIFPEKTNCTCL